MTEKLSQLLRTYSQNHQNKTNKKIHKFAVPLIMFSLLGLLSLLQRGVINAAEVAILGSLIYYAQFKSLKAFMIILVQVIPMMVLIYFNPLPYWYFYLAIFVIGWMAQFLGHKIEGQRPSFFTDVQFLLIGPLWIWDLENKEP